MVDDVTLVDASTGSLTAVPLPVGRRAYRARRRRHFDGARRYQRCGGGARVVSLDEALTVSPGRGREIVALDDALKALAEVDRRKSQVVELPYFGGLSVDETAAALDVSRIR